jgi:hypothetical protein
MNGSKPSGLAGEQDATFNADTSRCLSVAFPLTPPSPSGRGSYKAARE